MFFQITEKNSIFTTLEHIRKLNTNLLKGFFLRQNFCLVISCPQFHSVLVVIKNVPTTNKIVSCLFHTLVYEFVQQRTLCCLLVTKHNAPNIYKLAFFRRPSEMVMESPILKELETYDFSDRAKTYSMKMLSFTG